MWLQHFVKYVKSSVIQPISLLPDNCSHIDLSIIDFAKKHHITLLCFLQDCSHHLQPLDISLFGPFKMYKKPENELMDARKPR